MNDRDTGGPAFPAIEYMSDTGMTLRDYFAAKAMSALLSSDQLNVNETSLIPQAAYEIADAMLKERSK